jgi:thiamine pyrophosphate-dependent acetolactate synthase large subunit-like protein
MSPRKPPANGGQQLAQALHAQGVRCVYTLCGGHISPILVALRALEIQVIDVRDEASAVYAADAAARLSGLPGVALVTAGPGVSNTVTALKNAQLAQSPLLLIGGAAPTALQGRGALQDIDQAPLVAPHVKGLRRIRVVADLAPAVAWAFRRAQQGVPGPVFLECPVDLLYDESTIRGWYAEAEARGSSLAERLQRWYLRRHARRLFAPRAGAETPLAAAPLPRAGERRLRAAAKALRASHKPLLLIGSQALCNAADAAAVAAAVDQLGLPVYLSGMARGLLGRAHPRQLLHQRRLALRESDCVLLAGLPCDFRLDYGKHIRRKAVLIAANRSARDATLNRRPDIRAIGDAGDFLIRLAAELGSVATAPEWLATLLQRDRDREQGIAAEAAIAGTQINPVALLRAIEDCADDKAIFVADGGDFIATAAYTLRPRQPLGWLDPGVFGTLGVGGGFAIAAASQRPDAQVWLLWGDGACAFSIAEMDTLARHGLAVIAVVGNDACWSQIAREQVKLLGDPVGTVLARSDYHQVAAGFGAVGLLIRTPAEIADVLAQAMAIAASGRPVLVNVWLDRSEFREGSISM